MIVKFKDLGSDAADPVRIAEFWGGLLGLEIDMADGDPVILRRDGEPWLWVSKVSEPKTVKNRVHLDLLVPDPHDVPGATFLSEQDGFCVWADPEGNEFCAFPGEGPVRAFAMCADSVDPVASAAWWAERTGARIVDGPDGTPRYLDDVPGMGGLLWKFVPVDEPHTVKNRWHWDVIGPDVPEAEVLHPAGGNTPWTVMTDPEGNEFCAFVEQA